MTSTKITNASSSNYGPLIPEGYIPRLADSLVASALKSFGAVEITGARWTGKSWTARAFGSSVTQVDTNPSLYMDDPELALLGDSPHILDEWQDAPALWNRVRHRIDDKANRPGQFILTGSSTPPMDDERHTGAGRIARVRMHTMSMAETGVSDMTVSLAGLFEGQFEPAQCSLSLLDVAGIIAKGTWPALIGRSGASETSNVANEYLEAFFEVSIPKAGKSPTLARSIARSLARNTAASATLQTIAADASEGEDSILSTQTISSYLDIFQRNFLITPLHGWAPPLKFASRIRTKPKRYFDDPSLAATLLGASSDRIAQDGQVFGNLFENLAIHELATYAPLIPRAGHNPLSYYSDADDLEVDVIIELLDGRWAGIEIKLGESKLEQGVRNLQRLRKKVTANPLARVRPPEFMAVLVGHGEYARYLADEDIYVIPIGTLGP